MTEAKPNLPAKNLIPLLTTLDDLLESWGYEAIGKPWEQVSFNPQLHQPDSDEIGEGDLVYVRFVGYRKGEKIFCPAKVSQTLPGGNR
jgi:molecular chaperone GrpE (heat shock protein)